MKMVKKLFALVFALVSICFAYTEELQEFQRYALPENRNEFMVEGTLVYSVQGNGENEAYAIQPEIGIEYTVNLHTFRLGLPYVLLIYNVPDLKENVSQGFADMVLGYEYRKQLRQLNFLIGGF